MWRRFDEGLKRAILSAAEEAKVNRLTTTLLFQRVNAECAEAARLLRRLGASAALTDVEDRRETPNGVLGLTPEARTAFERTYQIAADLGDWSVRGEHFLLALVQNPETSDAGRALARAGVHWASAGAALIAMHPRRLRAPEGVDVPGLAARRLKKGVRAAVGRAARLTLGAPRYRKSFTAYALFHDRTARNPYPMYSWMRRKPVFWDPRMRQWVVTGYADVSAALAENRLSLRSFSPSVLSDEELAPIVQQEFRLLPGHLDRQMLFQDAPDQVRQRAQVAKRFTPRVIGEMRAQMELLVEEMLDGVAGRGRMELIADLAVPFPIVVIMRLLGLPEGERARFKKWSVDYFTHITFETTLEQDVVTYQSIREASEYFQTVIQERRENPGSDLISLLLKPDDRGERLSDQDVISNSMMLLATGHENTTRLIGAGVAALLTRPDQWTMLRNDPSLIGGAVEEFLRFDCPVQWVVRHLREDLEWRGHSMKKGQGVFLGLAAANRDPAQFPDPDRFDITREPNRHVAFGYGSHFCLGAALGRLETQIVVSALIARFPTLKLEEPIEWLDSVIAFRGPKSLDVAWD
jgi:pimeloyl-[acyl-carrier protein] synthase